MQGAKLVGVGSNVEKASLSIYSNDTLFLTISSTYFAFTNERIVGRNSEVIFRLKQDSIYHPDVMFMFNVKNKEVMLMNLDKNSCDKKKL